MTIKAYPSTHTFSYIVLVDYLIFGYRCQDTHMIEGKGMQPFQASEETRSRLLADFPNATIYSARPIQQC